MNEEIAQKANELSDSLIKAIPDDYGEDIEVFYQATCIFAAHMMYVLHRLNPNKRFSGKEFGDYVEFLYNQYWADNQLHQQ